VGASNQAEEQDRIEQVFEKGERLEPGRIRAKALYGESDGVFIPLQREAKKKVEVRVGMLRDEHFDLSKTTQLVVRGDGNSWVKQSFDSLELPTIFLLDRFHLYRNTRRAFGHTLKTETWIKNICNGYLEKMLPEMLAEVA